MDKLPQPLSQPPYDKKRCWIVWLMNEKEQITDIEIYETFPSNPGKVGEYLEFKLGKKSYYDCGNCWSDWDKWTLQDLFHKFGFQHEWEDQSMRFKFLKKLGEINEFKNDIDSYLRFHHAFYIPECY